jgi:hypothetical protein
MGDQNLPLLHPGVYGGKCLLPDNPYSMLSVLGLVVVPTTTPAVNESTPALPSNTSLPTNTTQSLEPSATTNASLPANTTTPEPPPTQLIPTESQSFNVNGTTITFNPKDSVAVANNCSVFHCYMDRQIFSLLFEHITLPGYIYALSPMVYYDYPASYGKATITREDVKEKLRRDPIKGVKDLLIEIVFQHLDVNANDQIDGVEWLDALEKDSLSELIDITARQWRIRQEQFQRLNIQRQT